MHSVVQSRIEAYFAEENQLSTMLDTCLFVLELGMFLVNATKKDVSRIEMFRKTYGDYK